jgi:hypothetical protein
MLFLSPIILAQESAVESNNAGQNIGQYYSLKAGFFNSRGGINNGLIFGLDGITEFYKYNLFLSGNVDFYQKKTINVFSVPGITSQSMILVPLHIDLGYKIAHFRDADSKIYAGIGVGYSLYFYNASYQTTSQGLIFNQTINNNVTKNSGYVFETIFGRILIGGIFVEPLYYFTAAKNDKIDAYSFNFNPSGFAVSFGFEY